MRRRELGRKASERRSSHRRCRVRCRCASNARLEYCYIRWLIMHSSRIPALCDRCSDCLRACAGNCSRSARSLAQDSRTRGYQYRQ
ncbi:hypothetical protein M430DRAFT_258861 [Amorphotheca resinae ATCC 22711]|uniref:Uncharacterized protein n=1 Tax=Amorphotheca resinae ATCC 22711 TaxID=857342 RepID=A0A2T3AZ06_AMORE|nr:hypothetical protein M430DRAFT_258861 [Amorphotheca resinae ATCC 22711]PSS15271.1 hypothetical protein M430DRAFT_258861 [Amorphotheca resinae ATCC 22711]